MNNTDFDRRNAGKKGVSRGNFLVTTAVSANSMFHYEYRQGWTI